MLAEIFSLGFDHVELGRDVRISQWEGIERFLSNHTMRVTSLHSSCPLHSGAGVAAPDHYECTAVRTEERISAQIHALRIIDYAQKLGAKFVVMHLGSVPMASYTERLCKLIHSGRYLSRSYVAMKLRAIQKREANSPFDRIAEWLKPVVDHAASTGVVVAIENRVGVQTCPSEREFRRLFSEIGAIGYWHDFGHAQIRHNLTLLDHAEWLREMSSRLVGCHIHDVLFPCSDHQVPFSGMIDFASLFTAVPPAVPLVWELNSQVSKDEITSALARWRQEFSS